MTAFVKCAGTCDKANQDYEYYGIEDCKMMDFIQNGGPKSCNCLLYTSQLTDQLVREKVQ